MACNILEINQKLEAVRAFLVQKGKSSLLISEQVNFSWLTGARGFLGLASTRACASLLITQKKCYLLANNIEGRRLMEEEGLNTFCELISVAWQEDGAILASACSQLGEHPIMESEMKSELDRARQLLCRQEQERYAVLCAEAAQALEEAIAGFSRGISEFEAAGRISSALWSRGIEPISLFVAADDRISRYRHFIPTDSRAQHQVVASICARRSGLVVSVTRSVTFDPERGSLKKHHDLLLRVETAGWKALQAGNPMSTVYESMCTAYAENGLDGEWNNHHQGGLTGYMPREIRIDSNTEELIRVGQAYAFNPSCRYAKAEDTVLLTETGVQILSVPSEQWPIMTIDGFCQPDVLIKSV